MLISIGGRSPTRSRHTRCPALAIPVGADKPRTGADCTAGTCLPRWQGVDFIRERLHLSERRKRFHAAAILAFSAG